MLCGLNLKEYLLIVVKLGTVVNDQVLVNGFGLGLMIPGLMFIGIVVGINRTTRRIESTIIGL